MTLAAKETLRMAFKFSNTGPTISFKDGVYDNIIPQPVLARLKLAYLLAQITSSRLPDDSYVYWSDALKS